MRQVLCFIIPVAVIGVLAHLIGEAIPRTFDTGRFPFSPFKWENNGKIYKFFHVQDWKTILPDKSMLVKGTVKKRIDSSDENTPEYTAKLIQESCVAELVHFVLIFCCPVLLFTMDPPYSYIMTILYGLSNLPYIIIQRYNRPRLVRYYEHQIKRAQSRGVN